MPCWTSHEAPFWRVIWTEADVWWPSHEDFTDEEAAHQFAADTMARVGEAEVHRIGWTS